MPLRVGFAIPAVRTVNSELAALDSVLLNSRVSSSKERSSQKGPPHNPEVRDLVEGKRRWSSSSDQESAKLGFRSWHERGYLPHRDQPGLIQLVTFHLEDSFPAALRSEWEALLKIENNLQRRTQLEAYLDKGGGECSLRHPEVAALVENALRFFHGQRYDLRAWVVMPNHVHVLFKVDNTPMSQVVRSWKRHTARQANRLLGRQGPFWQEDYWDTWMRDSQHEARAVHYIESNPVKPGLARTSTAWRWSSARFRDQYGRLCL